MKKALIGTALAGTLVASAGFGTYSWFTSETTAKGDIQNYTLQLDNTKVNLFDDASKKLAPGRTVSDEFTITNSGELEQKLRGQFKLSASKGVDYSKYEVTLKAYMNGSKQPFLNETRNGNQAINLANNWYPTANGAGVFKKGDSIKFTVDVKLLESAGNEFQGVTVGGEANIQAIQDDGKF